MWMLNSRPRIMAKWAQGRVLDIGFADAPNPYLAGEVWGFDRCRDVWPDNYTYLVQGLCENLCFAADAFDTIVAGQIIEHLMAPYQFLADCHRILKPKGRLVLSTTNPYFPPVVVLNWFLIPRFFWV